MEQLWETDSFVDDKYFNCERNAAAEKLEAAGLPIFITTKFESGI